MNRPRSERHRLSCQQFRDDLWDMHMGPILNYVVHLKQCGGCRAWFEEQVAVMQQQFPLEAKLGTEFGEAVAGLLMQKRKEEEGGHPQASV